MARRMRVADDAAVLALADGSVWHGRAVGAAGTAVGELVFNTAMSGYEEVLTDPSYNGQIVTFTHPHLGNTGINGEDAESANARAAGVVAREIAQTPSSWRSRQSLPDWLRESGVVGIDGVDTRALTRRLRDGGAQAACIIAGADAIPAAACKVARGHPGLVGADLACLVSTARPHRLRAADGAGDKRPRRLVLVYDYGVKRSILQQLRACGCDLQVVPADWPLARAMECAPQGVVLSNGPGDPAACDYAIATAREILRLKVPVLGICLGHQILGLACGARMEKMKFGHHGANHPVRCLQSGQVFITSQNHGFAIADDELPDDLQITHRSLFDDSIQGLAHRRLPMWGLQGHPEAGPGPWDARSLIADFVDRLAEAA